MSRPSWGSTRLWREEYRIGKETGRGFDPLWLPDLRIEKESRKASVQMFAAEDRPTLLLGSDPNPIHSARFFLGEEISPICHKAICPTYDPRTTIRVGLVAVGI